MTPIEKGYAHIAGQLFPPVRENVILMGTDRLMPPGLTQPAQADAISPVATAAMVHFGLKVSRHGCAEDLASDTVYALAPTHLTAIFPEEAKSAIQASEIARFQLAINALQPSGSVHALFSAQPAVRSVLAQQRRLGLIIDSVVTYYPVREGSGYHVSGELFVLLAHKTRDTEPLCVDAVRVALNTFGYGTPPTGPAVQYLS